MDNMVLGTILTFAGPIFYFYQNKDEFIDQTDPYTETIYGFGIENGKALAAQGFLLCNGKAFSTGDPQLQELTKFIGKCWGGSIVNGSPDYFRIPALEGMFLRGTCSDSNKDPDVYRRAKLNSHDPIGGYGNMIGSYQADEIISHDHLLRTDKQYGYANQSGAFKYTGTNSSACYDNVSAMLKKSGGAETRSKNVYVNFIIKASLQPIDLGKLQMLNL